MKGILASRRKKELEELQRNHLTEEFRSRIEGTRTYNTFDLEDVGKIGLEVLSDPMLRDVKKVILWADEKRRTMEDYRAWRRNRNGWLVFAVSLCVGVFLPFIVDGISVWLLNALTLVPQSVLLAVKTMRKY